LKLETGGLEGDRWQGGVRGVGCVSKGKGIACLMKEEVASRLPEAEGVGAVMCRAFSWTNLLAWRFKNRKDSVMCTSHCTALHRIIHAAAAAAVLSTM